ncbi:flagellar export protein FliJ [Castellaniella sp. GW247-6E4]|uniref:flagellar export protein FliJ n=1 Tax=Castellaniella sp. GW247-6E4 TaxID=3140380 RepID=UPI0033159399
MANERAPLAMLIELSRNKVEDAGRLLAELSTQRRQAQGQLDTLDGYRGDYAKRLQASTHDGVSASNYHNFRRFIATLDEAISQQNKIIAQIDTRLDAGRQQWTAEKRRLSSYEALKARQDRQAQSREQRLEQRISDELSAGLHRRARRPH